MRKLMNSGRLYIISLLLLYPSFYLKGQTCCTGGTPLIGNLGVQNIAEKTWYFQLSYDYNFLNKLYQGDARLQDNSRERLTQTLLFQGIYAINSKFSVNGLFSMVEQKRTIFSPTGETNRTKARGLGDAIILAQFTAVSNLKRSLVLAAGPKLPIGKFNAVDPDFGITLSPDLQPGSGSFDAILAASFTESHLFNWSGLSLVSSAGYRITSEAKRFDGDNPYRFGNETLLSMGIQKNFVTPKLGLTPSFFTSFRKALADKADGAQVAGTGGAWLNFNPAISIETPKYISLIFSGEIPIYRKLNGAQLTTSYRFNVALAIKLSNNK